jgi:type IV pilus assembly protein PilN
MIKINLVSDTPAAAATKRKSKGPEISLGAKQGDIILLAALAVFLAIAGVYWFMLNSQVNSLRQTEAARRAERNELQKYIDKVSELENKRNELRTKIDTIRQLKENQKGPVRILDEISRALPDLVWLTGMDIKGGHITLNGSAMDENAIANYISNLYASPFFTTEPTLINFQRGKQDSFNFRLECDFTYSPAQIEAANDGSEG